MENKRRIGRYAFLRRIGEGGMGDVYLAKREGAAGFEKLVAVKVIASTQRAKPASLALFEREAWLCGSLKHRNIVDAYDYIVTRTHSLLAMEYVRGWSVFHLIHRAGEQGKTLPVDAAVYILSEVCQGLAYALSARHPVSGEALRLVHCDVSPQNIMISCDGRVKLVDFGLASASPSMGGEPPLSFRGKLGYMAPELLQGAKPSPSTDVYAAAVVLHELLSGRRLFPGRTLTTPGPLAVEPPSASNPAVPEVLDGIVMKALSSEPFVRHRDAAELARELERFLGRCRPSFSDADLATLLLGMFGDDERPGEIANPGIPERPDRSVRGGVPARLTSDDSFALGPTGWRAWLTHPGVLSPVASMFLLVALVIFTARTTPHPAASSATLGLVAALPTGGPRRGVRKARAARNHRPRHPVTLAHHHRKSHRVWRAKHGTPRPRAI